MTYAQFYSGPDIKNAALIEIQKTIPKQLKISSQWYEKLTIMQCLCKQLRIEYNFLQE